MQVQYIAAIFKFLFPDSSGVGREQRKPRVLLTSLHDKKTNKYKAPRLPEINRGKEAETKQDQVRYSKGNRLHSTTRRRNIGSKKKSEHIYCYGYIGHIRV